MSDPISCSPTGPGGPILLSKPRKKKSLNDIYENLKIPFFSSYFSALIHSANNATSYFIPYKHLPCPSHLCSEVEDSISRYSGGSILCCESINDSDVNQGNSCIRRVIEDVPTKVWQIIKELGIEGDEDDELFEGIIRDMKLRGMKRCEAKIVASIRVP